MWRESIPFLTTMAGIFVYSREAIRVKVKKCEGFLQPEFRKFSVDPQITSFEVLQSLLAKAFDIKGDFTVCYRTFDDYGQETFLPLLSDWDLDAAFLSASDPYLCLQVDMKPFEESSDEWEVGPVDVVRSQAPEHKSHNRLPGLIMNQVERTFNMVQRALNLVEDQQSSVTNQPPRPPLADVEFRKFLDPIGQVVQSRDLRTVIYLGGIEPSLRKVVWKHILNVYPDGLSGKERMDYMKRKSLEYQSLRDCWRNMVQNGQVTGDLAYVTSMVRKDVLRTDRHHRFYAGSDDNQNIASLFNILTTYALNHPTVSYCQGMSDLASPLLVTMGDEAHAYICFCALMKRLQTNFMLDGVTMTLKFQHLAEGLMYYDPEFYAYLKGHQADDLLFCYRWLLLEMKREFAFDDALRMLEVLWSSLPQMPPDKDLPLFERQFCSQSPGDSPPPISPLLKTPRENAYTKVCALRRQSSAASLHSMSNGSIRGLRSFPGSAYRQNQSLDETIMASNVKKSSKVKPFSSLDDTSIQFHSAHSEKLKSRPASPVETLSEPENDASSTNNNPTNIQPNQSRREISVSTGSLLSKVAEKKDRLKELKEKFASEKAKSVFSSFDNSSMSDLSKVESQFSSEKKRVVKNLNEFLNFASFNKNRLLNSLSPKQENCQIVRESSVISEDSDKTLSGDSKQGSISEDIIPEACGETLEDLTPQNEVPGKGSNFEVASHFPKSKNIDDVGCDCSSPDDSAEYFPMTTSMTRELRLELENLDRHVFGSKFSQHSFTLEDSEDVESPCSESFRSIELKIESGGVVQKCDCVLSKQESDIPSEDTTTEVAEICSAPVNKAPGLVLNLDKSWHSSSLLKEGIRNESVEKHDSLEKDKEYITQNNQTINCSQNYSPGVTLGAGEEIFVWENPLQCPTTPDEQAELEYDGTISSSEGESCFNSSISAGEIFENEGPVVKSVTPIRLLRSGGSVQCTNNTGTSESLTDDTSDSSDGWGGQNPLSLSQNNFSLSNFSESAKANAQTPQIKAKVAKELQHLPGAMMTNSCEEMLEQVSSQVGSLRNSGECSENSNSNNIVKSDLLKHRDSFASKQLPSNNLQLPPPHKFGDGNPFLMFLCLTVLLQHRDHIMRSAMDYNEMAMHFDKMVRKHNVTRVLNHARQMYTAYLRHQATLNNNTSHGGMDLNV